MDEVVHVNLIYVNNDIAHIQRLMYGMRDVSK